MTDLKIIEYGVIKIDPKKLEAAFVTDGGLNEFLKATCEKMREEKDKLSLDMAVAKNRKALKSLATAVKGAKGGSLFSFIDKSGSELYTAKKETIAKENAELALISSSKNGGLDVCRNLHTEIIAPAVEWEEKEKARKKESEELIERIAHYRNGDYSNTSPNQMRAIIESLEAIEASDAVAIEEKASSLGFLNMALELAETREKEASRQAEEEKARLKKEAEEKADKKLEADRIAAKAAEQRALEESVRIRLEKIQDIRNLGMIDEGTISEAIDYRLKLLRKVDLSARNFGAARQEAQEAYEETAEQLILDHQAALEREKKQAEAKSIQDKLDAEERDKQVKIRAERQADEALRRKEEEAQKEREHKRANAAHRKKIHGEIQEDLAAAGLDKAAAATMIFLISSGKVRNIEIKY